MPETAKPAGVNGGHRKLLVANGKAHPKNSLQGFLSFILTCGRVVHNRTLHERNGARWIGLLSRRYQKDGSTAYAPPIEFTTQGTWHCLKAAVLVAVDGYMEGTHHE